MLAEGRKTNRVQKGGRPEKRVPTVPISDLRTEKPLTLAELGLDKRAAAQTRKLAKYAPAEFETRLKAKLEKGELSRTSTLEDPPLKKEPTTSRHLMALLKDFQQHPASYDARVFAGDEKLLALYQQVRERLLSFVQALDVEAISNAM
jgi:hypothetical protein